SREPAQQRDYWDDPRAAAGHEDDAVAVTSPDTHADHPATEPDMFGAGGRRSGGGTAEMPPARAGGEPGAPTIADGPAPRTPLGEPPVTETPAGEVAAPAGDVLATAADTTGSTGRHAAANAAGTPADAVATPGNGELRPGEAADPGLRPGEA